MKKIMFFVVLLVALILTGCKANVSYSITFNSNGGTDILSVQSKGNTAITIPDDPTKDGYVFDGWYWDNNEDINPFTANSLLDEPLSSNVTVYAKWNIVTYNITYVLNGGTNGLNPNTYTIETETIILNNPTKEGYTFNGWFNNIDLTGAPVTQIAIGTTGDVTAYAKWTINQYTITFNSNQGSLVAAITQNFGTTVTAPTIPTREGYTFDTWYSDITLTVLYTFTNMPAENITLYAKWTIKQYTLSFNSNQGSLVDAITQDYGTAVISPSDPTREGYTFDAWYSDESLTTAYIFTSMPTENIMLYAKWNVNQYTLSFNSNGGSLVTAITQDYNTAVISPSDPTREGYTFAGWYSDVTLTVLYIFTNMPADNITLYGKWNIATYNITYVLNGGTNGLNPNNYTVETQTITLNNPTKEGYTFNGWFRNIGLTGALVTQVAIGTTGDVILYAKWTINQYTLSFNSNGGSLVTAITQDYGTTVTEPTIPTREEYTFAGWYSDITLTVLYIFTNMPAENIMVYAKWNIVTYNITYVLNGGINGLNPNNYTFETQTITLNNPTKEGYTFDGWFNNIELTGDPVAQISLGTTGDVTLYAKWTINQYTITFNSNQGSLVDAITQDYGTPVTEPTIPTREGYTFSGWYSDITLTITYIFTNMPAETITVYAKWTINQYTLSFNSNGGSLVIAITQDYNTAVTAPTIPTREGYTFAGWYSDITLTTTYIFTNMPAENITLYAKWTINQYTITFNSNQGSLVDAITQDYNTAVISPSDPTREGYTFAGWYSDITLTVLYTFTNMPAENITLYAKWNIVTYDITYVLNGGTNGSNPDTYTVETQTITLNNPTKEGYTFDGWFNNADLTGTPVTQIAIGTTGNITLYAKWTINQYTITFNSNQGSVVAAITQDYGTTVTAPTIPTREGYAFADWYSDEVLTVLYTFTSMPAENITLYAKWTINQYTITFNSNQGSVVDAITQDYGTTVTAPTIPTREGYTFADWYSDGSLTTAYTFTSMPAQNITLYAKWTINQYTITFNSNQGSLVAAITQDYGTTVTEPTIPTKEGYTFAGWYSDITLTTSYIFTTMPAQNITLYAKWNIVTYDITYVLNGGTNGSNPDTYTVETETITLNNPTKEGYTFNGWFNNIDLTGAPVIQIAIGTTGNITLYAKWTINQYTLSFNSNGGSLVTAITQDYNTAVISPSDPIREGYTFADWYSDITLTIAYTFTNMPAENITLYAKWNIVTYNITYVLNGGINGSNPNNYTIETQTITLSNPTKEGHTFNGWFNNAELTGDLRTQIAIGTTGDITLYAKWTINQYTITFNSNQGSVVAAITQDYGTTVTAPTIPTREGYTFDAWYSDITLTTSYTFTTMSAENITLYAKWTINQYTLSFNSNGGSLVAAITQDYGTTVTAPTIPTREGYTFEAWYSDITLTTAYTFTSMPAQNITLYAKWTINQYTITFNSNQGSLVAAITQDYGTTVTEPTIPTKEGYTFAGWYSDITLTTLYIFTTMPAQNITLYAKWTINQYTITYGIFTDECNPLLDILLYPGETITEVSLGYYHSSAITSEGRIFTWGRNNYGQLGDGTITDKSSPVDITSRFNLNVGETITEVSLGFDHSSAITSEGRIFTWGRNEYGQLGDGTITDKSSPVDITSRFNLNVGETITEVSLGGYHSSAITSKARIFTWGRNNYGQLGDETTTDKSTPFDITSKFNLGVGETITEVSLGSYHSSATTSTGRIFTWGRNNYGQLGDETTTSKSTPVDITSKFNLSGGETITEVSIGGYHSSAITSEGDIFTWGHNEYGQLGDGTQENKSTPVEITSQFNLSGGETITKVSLGSYHSSAITSDGRIFTWGINSYGQLGEGTRTDKSTPVDITSRFNLSVGETITEVSLAGSHSSAITSAGRFFTWGYNSNGELGDGTKVVKSTPVSLKIYTPEIDSAITYNYGETIINYIPTLAGFTFAGWYSDIKLATPFTNSTMPAENIILYGKWNIVTYNITYVLKGGTNGLNPDNYTIETETIILNNPTKEGYTFNGWFNNADLTGAPVTQIAIGTTGDITLYAKWNIVTYNVTYVLNGVTNGLNPDTYTIETETITLSNPTKEGYTFNGWFNNIDLTGAPVTQIAIGTTGDITLYAKWNIITYDITFQLDGGINGANPNTYTVETQTITLNNPTKEGYTFNGWFNNIELTGDPVTQIAIGTTGDITLYAKWTINQYTITYRIFTDEYNPLLDILLYPGETIAKVSIGWHHSSAITSEARIFTWGYNNYGQLGDGTQVNKSIPVDITSQFNLGEGETITEVSLGLYHSSAITSEGRIFTWGYNGWGQLGDGTTTDKSTPVDITSRFNLSIGETITEVSLGLYHSSAITSEARIFTWGNNVVGQLGDGTTTYKSTPVDITSQLNLNVGETITEVSIGGYNSSVITSIGRIFTWGNNEVGQLGDETTVSKSTPVDITSKFNLNGGETITEVSIGGSHSSVITSEGRIFTWGYNRYGQLGDGTTEWFRFTPVDITSQFNLSVGETITEVSLGEGHSSAITSEARILTWGWNMCGQLGDETTTDKSIPVDITSKFNLNLGETIAEVSLGGYHSSTITSEGRIFNWGDNCYGQLGDGTTIDRSTPVLLNVYIPEIDSTITYNYGETIINYIPILAEFRFDGWYSDITLATPFTNSTMPGENIILYGKWKIAPL